jgi:malonyl-CoA decarboxylase
LEASPPRSWIERVWSSIADRGRAFVSVPASLPPSERAIRLAEALLSGRGEASGAALARDLLAVLRGLDAEARLALYRHLAAGFTPDEARLKAAAAAYLAEPTPARAAALADAAEPPRQELLRRMNHAQGGTLALVRMREELLGLLRAHPELKPLDEDLRHLFASWFNRGFLELRRIDWNTPAAVLEKLIHHEAVHEIQGWPDLRRRLAADRRCFGFFHPALPGEPLIFVEVALTVGLADAVQPLLAQDTDEAAQRARAGRADTAIFYSISNCQDGLRGVSFGNFLIKQVVEELKAELPQLQRFSTLSPIPGLRRHVERDLPAGLPEEVDPATADEATRELVLRACARFLTDTREGRGPADPVARFHLGNGARLERINWAGNLAPRGVAESWGVMVNYLYDPETIETNHEAFARGGVVARSAAVEALLQPAKAGRGGRRG